ncbi:MAG: aminopeptidase P family protein [Planctomycetota bacterium]|nr:aminopeptidase P family protein [Planctomycetota bacterium]
MPSLEHFTERRSQFLDRIDTPVLLVAGGEVSRNYPANVSPYRPDSNFLYFFDSPEPGSAALFDPADRSVTLYLKERTPEDALWHGAVPSFEAMLAHHGTTSVRDVGSLVESVQQQATGRQVRSIAVVDRQATELAMRATGETLEFLDSSKIADKQLIQAIGQLRAVKMPEEISAMRDTAAITVKAHEAAMAHTRAGGTEQELAGIVTGILAQHGCVPAYNNILSVRGEVLHNNHHGNTLQDGDLVLLDAGAESKAGYCSDVTRTWPVSGKFEGAAAEVYDIVLAAEKDSINAVRPGARYRDLHMISARTIAEGLVGMGILNGDPDSLIECGAHALFFPHGVGHLIGIDVHDMEGFGDAIAYPEGRARSEQFGTGYLRLDMDLQAGMCFTIEPGIYFVPAILQSDEFRSEFKDQVNWDKACDFLSHNDGRGFGGVRIEDDVLCTAEGHEVLTVGMAKERAEVEALVGTAF